MTLTHRFTTPTLCPYHSDLARAREAALRSFDDLAELRADLNQTVTSSSAHFAPKILTGESPSGVNKGMGKGLDSCMGDLNGSGVSTFSGIFPCNPPRGGMENTATILQGSIVIAEADALIMSFRQSFLAPSSSSNAGMYMSTSAQPGNTVKKRSAIEEALEDRRSSNALALDGSILYSNDSNCDMSGQFLPSEADNRGSSANNNSNNNHNKSIKSRRDDSIDEFEMFAFLEKYTDRLADMVSDKMIAKSIALEKSYKTP
jgi:hypothetical protein